MGKSILPKQTKIPAADKDITIRRAKWNSLKEEFLELCISGRDPHWPTLANKYGFLATTVRNKASQERWYDEIEKRRKDREDILDEKLTARTSMVIEDLNKDFATNELAIRKRHATMARGLQGRAITRLKEIPLAEFSARDALAMLKLGIDEERFAMGMPQTYGGEVQHDTNPAFKPLVEQIGGHQKVQRIGMLLLEAIKATPLDDDMLEASGLGPIDVQPKLLADGPVYLPVPEAGTGNPLSKSVESSSRTINKKAVTQ